MGIRESNIQTRIHLAVSQLGVRLFRNNVAKAWIGKSIRFQSTKTVTVEKGDVLIKNARRLNAGLCVGSSDLIGWTPVTITPEMVGETVAVFTGVEVKTPTGKLTKDQKRFLNAVELAGGIGLVGRDAEAVRQYLAEMIARN